MRTTVALATLLGLGVIAPRAAHAQASPEARALQADAPRADAGEHAPMPAAARVALSASAGWVAGVAGGYGGFGAGYGAGLALGCVNFGCVGVGVLSGVVLAPVSTSLAVVASQSAMGRRGSFLATLGGATLGTVAGVFGTFALYGALGGINATQLAATPLLAAVPAALGAVAGFELTATDARALPTRASRPGPRFTPVAHAAPGLAAVGLAGSF